MTPHKRTLALSDDILMRVEKPARYIGAMGLEWPCQDLKQK